MCCITECTGAYFDTIYTSESDSNTINMCRPLTYYVNPDSEQMMELGTIEYPFKDINLVFLDILNIHQHTDRTINVFVMEATDSYLPFDVIKIVNITQLNIDTYTDSDYYEPRNANFRIVETPIEMKTSRSIMNIIQNVTVGDIDVSRMEEHEIFDLTFQQFVAIHVHRSSISLNHINAYTEYATVRQGDTFMYTSYCFNKNQSFVNMYTDLQAHVFINLFASTNVYAENITMNMTKGFGGFSYYSA